MVDDALREARQHMEASIGSVTHDFNTLRTGRASISILDDVVVEGDCGVSTGDGLPVGQSGETREAVPPPQLGFGSSLSRLCS